MPKILFRADASPKSGTGDLLSLIYLSEYFKGWEKYFVIQDTNEAGRIIRENGVHGAVYIERNISIRKELNFLNAFIRKNNISAVFLEITARSDRQYENLKAPFKGCVNFDGVIPRGFDLVVNWDVNADKLYKKNRHSGTEFLLGPRYVFLRKEMLQKRVERSCIEPTFKKHKNILVFFGGFDEFDLTFKITEALETMDSSINLKIIIGAGYRHKKELMRYLDKSRFHSYKIRQNVKDMRKEYAGADLALMSGGLSLFEALALKIPVAVIAAYKHQIGRSVFFDKAGAALYLGFRRFDSNKLKAAIGGHKFKCFDEKFLVNTIPGIVNERLGYKG